MLTTPEPQTIEESDHEIAQRGWHPQRSNAMSPKQEKLSQSTVLLFETNLLSVCVVVFSLLALLVSGCQTAVSLSEPIGKFRTATQAVTVTSMDYFLQLNQRERNFSFFEIHTDKTKNVDATVTKAIFSGKGIQARLRALMVVDLYSARLAEVVDADTSTQLGTNVDALGISLKSLGDTVKSITDDDTVTKYAEPITALVGFVSAMWIEHERQKALKTAIADAAPQVTRILILLEDDLQKAHDDRVEYALLKYNELRLKYNKERESLSDPVRKERLIELEDMYNKYEEISTLSPVGVVSAMRNAHDAMIKSAENFGKIEDFRNFVTAVELFSMRVKEASAIYKAFRDTE